MARSLFFLLALLAALALVGCGRGAGEPVQLQLADLARFAEDYDGRRVQTTGTVRSHPDPEHYWIEDDALNRVSVEPQSSIASHVGERVRVSGQFRFSRDEGRAIEATTVEPVAH